jgi:hypothetical protein
MFRSSVPSRAQTREAQLLLANEGLCRNEADRVQTASLVVDKLPRTARDIQLLLLGTPHRLSREVQYSILNCLDYSTISPQNIKLLLPAVAELLNNVSSETAYVWMKLGCLLGDGWLRAADAKMRHEIIHTILNAVRSARFVSGRKGALHGIEHALNIVSLHQGKKLLEVVREVARTDRSVSVRRSAYFILHKGRWWGSGESTQLQAYARKLGKLLQYPQPLVKRRAQASRRP